MPNKERKRAADEKELQKAAKNAKFNWLFLVRLFPRFNSYFTLYSY